MDTSTTDFDEEIDNVDEADVHNPEYPMKLLYATNSKEPERDDELPTTSYDQYEKEDEDATMSDESNTSDNRFETAHLQFTREFRLMANSRYIRELCNTLGEMLALVQSKAESLYSDNTVPWSLTSSNRHLDNVDVIKQTHSDLADLHKQLSDQDALISSALRLEYHLIEQIVTTERRMENPGRQKDDVEEEVQGEISEAHQCTIATSDGTCSFEYGEPEVEKHPKDPYDLTTVSDEVFESRALTLSECSDDVTEEEFTCSRESFKKQAETLVMMQLKQHLKTVNSTMKEREMLAYKRKYGDLNYDEEDEEELLSEIAKRSQIVKSNEEPRVPSKYNEELLEDLLQHSTERFQLLSFPPVPFNPSVQDEYVLEDEPDAGECGQE